MFLLIYMFRLANIGKYFKNEKNFFRNHFGTVQTVFQKKDFTLLNLHLAVAGTSRAVTSRGGQLDCGRHQHANASSERLT